MRKTKSYFSLTMCTILYCLVLFSITIVQCGHAEVITDTSAMETPRKSLEEESYSYAIEGRPDPFKPFVSSKTIMPLGPDPNEIVEDSVELSGMRLFEPGQLTLVGTMLSPQKEIALVEDQTRKGYILKIGMPIGKRGIVTHIESEQVIITETAKTRAGQEIKSTVTMRLNKEGDK